MQGKVKPSRYDGGDMRIGELATSSGTTTKTLRFYEQAGLLPAPDRTPGGYRDYALDVLPRLSFIRRSRTAGLTLAQIRSILDIRDAGTAPCRHVEQLLSTRLADLDQQIAELRSLRATVTRLLTEGAVAEDPAACEPTTVCRYL